MKILSLFIISIIHCVSALGQIQDSISFRIAFDRGFLDDSICFKYNEISFGLIVGMDEPNSVDGSKFEQIIHLAKGDNLTIYFYKNTRTFHEVIVDQAKPKFETSTFTALNFCATENLKYKTLSISLVDDVLTISLFD